MSPFTVVYYVFWHHNFDTFPTFRKHSFRNITIRHHHLFEIVHFDIFLTIFLRFDNIYFDTLQFDTIITHFLRFDNIYFDTLQFDTIITHFLHFDNISFRHITFWHHHLFETFHFDTFLINFFRFISAHYNTTPS